MAEVSHASLSLKNEVLSDEELNIKIQGNHSVRGALIKPDQIEVIQIESSDEPSYALIFALTWDHPDRVPLRHPSPSEDRVRRLAIRVDQQAVVNFAEQLLCQLAPQYLHRPRTAKEEVERHEKSIEAKALAKQARGRCAEMEALASQCPQTGTNKLFMRAVEHYKKEADYWDMLAGTQGKDDD